MLKIERHNIIEQEIRKQGFVLVPGLSALLACSEETIRRDLKEMEQAGKLVRTHGGAYLVEKYDKGYIMLDASTTCLSIAEMILARGISVTLITNSLAVFTLCSEANSNVNLIGVGGTFRRRTSSFADPNTVEALRGYYADKAFISCPKLSPEFGLSDNHISEANVRKQMLKNAQKRFLVVDHTKFEGTANILFDGLESIDVLITDQKLPEEWESFAQRHGIELRYAAE